MRRGGGGAGAQVMARCRVGRRLVEADDHRTILRSSARHLPEVIAPRVPVKAVAVAVAVSVAVAVAVSVSVSAGQAVSGGGSSW